MTLDGSTKVTFTAEVVGAPEDSSTTSSSGPTQRQDADDGVTSSTLIHSDDKGGTTVSQGMNVTFFHCMAGSIWTYLSDGEDLSCVLCTDIPEADTEVLGARYVQLYTHYIVAWLKVVLAYIVTGINNIAESKRQELAE